MTKQDVLKKYMACMQKGDNVALADLFDRCGVLHDSSLIKLGKDTLHLEGRMAVEMMFHQRFGFNGGPFPITGITYRDDAVWYFISYGDTMVQVNAVLTEMNEDGTIHRLNIYPL